MPTDLAPAQLLDCLKSLAVQQGHTVTKATGTVLEGHREAIKAKWLLGGTRTVYDFSCHLDDAAHTATFRESIFDKSWGLPPPTFRMESYSQSGTTVSSSTTQTSLGGGGTLDFGAWREICAQAAANAGWRFIHQPMRSP